MARIGFLFLIALCIYLAFDQPVFAQPIDVVLQDTVKKKNGKDTLRLDTAQIIRKNLLAKDMLDQKKEEYKSIYFWGDTKNMVTLPHQGGIAVNLNKLYNKFSRKGRHARKLQRKFEKEYQQDLIREEWYVLTKEYSKLSGDSLNKFRIYYEPSLTWLYDHDRYEKIAYVHKCLKYYLDSVDIIHRRLQLPMGNAKL
ncbi:hypothetical protein [Sphingobacterium prati]|uniref:hypothetical protein n=1 Tax=Sphingobacterium prati TaxID=2737006 RepID=UPI0015553F35|nr:hypothetical protein [Sphingobacterium prati]NPE46531.1 hypothetical protein [Sphingobacterium prati]